MTNQPDLTQFPRLTGAQIKEVLAAVEQRVYTDVPYPNCFVCGALVEGQLTGPWVGGEGEALLTVRPCGHRMTYNTETVEQIKREMTAGAATEATGAPDVCRPVEVDGETIRVRGSGDLTPEAQDAITALVRVAKAKLEADHAPATWKVLRAVGFNAIGPVLKEREQWLPLSVRRAVADAVLDAVEERLTVGDEQAWCKSCRRVWEGREHQCESPAEREVAAARKFAAEMREFCSPHGVAADYADRLLEAMDRAKEGRARPIQR